MTFEEAQLVVQRLTYRPGWRIEFYQVLGGAAVLRVGTDEPNSEAPTSDLTPVVYTSAMQAGRLAEVDEQELLSWIYKVFHERVVHELNEWLRCDGRPLVEPHPEQGWKRGVLTNRV